MKKKLVLFLIGITLFLISLPMSTKMIMELIHNQKMNEHYKITKVNEGYPATQSTYNFQDHIIEVEETVKEEKSFIDPWENKTVIADLSIKFDGENIDTLINHPIRVAEKGLNRYYGEIAYLILEDKKEKKSQFIILLKKTREVQKEMPNGDIVGGVPAEKLNYKLYTLNEKGNINSQSFDFNERDALQTELLNAGGVVPYSIGYYTDAWEWYPSLLFPLLFPFLTFIIGLILTLVFLPLRRVKK